MKIKIFTLLALPVIAFTLLSFFLNNPITPVHAQTCRLDPLNQGLISALSITGGGTFGNADQTCVYDAQAAYRDFKVPSYEDLENEFYTVSRSSAKKNSPLLTGALNFSGDGIYKQTTSMNIDSASGTGVQIIFIDGNLYLTGNINYADTDPYSGLVFIVSGDINIDSKLTKVNAVLISSGIICTAYDASSTSCLTGTTLTPQLTINGSLISLNRNNLPDGLSAIKLVRNLATNNQPAELINKQAKYLYLLKGGLLTKDLVLIEEDKNYASVTADPGSTPLPSQTPAPSPCQGANPLAISTLQDVVNCIIGI